MQQLPQTERGINGRSKLTASPFPKEGRVLQHNPRQKRTCPSLPAPALCECRHRGLARRSVAARRVTTLIVPECQRPQPGHSCGRGEGLEETTDNDAVRQHIKIILV